MVAGTRCLLALLLPQVLLGGAAGLLPELGRRKFAAAAAAAAGRPSSQPSEDILSEFELRLLSMFGLKQRPTPSRDAVVPPYMLDLYRRHSGQPGAPAPDHRLERAASRANTVRSFHHEGKARRWEQGRGRGLTITLRSCSPGRAASVPGERQGGRGTEAAVSDVHASLVRRASQGFPVGRCAPCSWLAARTATLPSRRLGRNLVMGQRRL